MTAASMPISSSAIPMLLLDCLYVDVILWLPLTKSTHIPLRAESTDVCSLSWPSTARAISPGFLPFLFRSAASFAICCSDSSAAANILAAFDAFLLFLLFSASFLPVSSASSLPASRDSSLPVSASASGFAAVSVSVSGSAAASVSAVS